MVWVRTGRRSGYLEAEGRRFAMVFKQDFPMQFWYGLTPRANRETSDELIDIRHLPETYREGLQIEATYRDLPPPGTPEAARRWNEAILQERVAHREALSRAVRDGFDFKAHLRAQEERYERDAAERRARAKPQIDDDDVPF